MTETIHTQQELLKLRKTLTSQAKSIGFVPTMGHLHHGHVSLLQQAREHNDIVLLSIFINPTQFDNVEDYTHYPQTLTEDLALAAQAQVDYVYLPTEEMLYKDKYRYKITETTLSQQREGKYRPGHFDGMLTVVMKLLNLVKPARAYFGEKDYQQLELIRGMVEAFFLETDIMSCPTIRESSGLAYSSRNSRLNPTAHAKAHEFYQVLCENISCEEIAQKLRARGFSVEYIEEDQTRRYGAVYLDSVRLIDNIPIKARLC